MLRGFKNFLLGGNVVVVAVGLMVALAVSTLIEAFTTSVIDPLLNRAQGKTSIGLGVQLGAAGNAKTFLDIGSFVSAVIYFIVFMAVLYFLIVVPYRLVQARRGVAVFGDPAPAQTCPFCLSEGLPLAATKCRYCASELKPPAEGAEAAVPSQGR
jgi:large conductance mechanosensitive channel